MNAARTARWLLASAGAAFWLFTLLADPPAELPLAGWRTLGVAVLMGCFWISEILPFAVTALFPVVLLPASGVASIQSATSPFANPVIFLFLGGIFIAIAMERTGLHRRIALGIISCAGVRKRAVIGGFLAASGFLSMWINNTAVAVMMLPIGLSVLALFHMEKERPFACALLLAIAYGANIGGMATLVGTPPNAILAGFMEETHGIEIGFTGWLLMAGPLSLLLLAGCWLYLTRLGFDIGTGELPGGRDLIASESLSIGTMKPSELRVAIVFAVTALLWILRGALSDIAPWLTDPGIAMSGGLLLFLLPEGKVDSPRILDLHAFKKAPWDVLILIGGGLSLAQAIQSTGVAAWIGSQASHLGMLPMPLVIGTVTLLIVWLTEITSNSATTSTFLPIAASLAIGLGENPLFLGAAVALASSCAFMMPVATPPNAIVFGSGRIPLAKMMRTGVALNFLAWLIVSSWLIWIAPHLPGLAF